MSVEQTDLERNWDEVARNLAAGEQGSLNWVKWSAVLQAKSAREVTDKLTELIDTIKKESKETGELARAAVRETKLLGIWTFWMAIGTLALVVETFLTLKK